MVCLIVKDEVLLMDELMILIGGRGKFKREFLLFCPSDRGTLEIKDVIGDGLNFLDEVVLQCALRTF